MKKPTPFNRQYQAWGMEYQPKFKLSSFYIADTSYKNFAPFPLKVGTYSYKDL